MSIGLATALQRGASAGAFLPGFLAPLMQGLIEDLRTGLAPRARVCEVYGPPLRGIWGGLEAWVGDHPELASATKELKRWTAKEPPPPLYSFHRLRHAAEAVFTVVHNGEETSVPPLTAQVCKEYVPSPASLHETFARLPESLQSELRRQAEALVLQPEGNRFRGSDVDYNPYLFRAAVVRYLEETLPVVAPFVRRFHNPQISPPLTVPDKVRKLMQSWQALVAWLVTTDAGFQNDFFEYCQKRPFLRGKEFRAFQEYLNVVNEVCDTSYAVVKETVPKRARGFIFRIRAVSPDPERLRLWRKATKRSRDLILKAAGVKEAVLLSSDYLQPDLARAIVRLNPLVKRKGKAIAGTSSCLGAMAGIFHCFLSPSLEDQGDLFSLRLPAMGLNREREHLLIAHVNRTCHTRFHLASHGNARLVWVEENPPTEEPFLEAVREVSPDLQKSWRGFVPEVLKRNTHLQGYTLTTSAELARETAVFWMQRRLATLPESLTEAHASLVAQIGSFLGWLCQQSTEIQHNFFKQVVRTDPLKALNYPAIKCFVDRLNLAAETTYVFETELAATKEGKERRLYRVTQVSPDEGIQERFSALVPDDETRKRIVEASGLPKTLLLTPSKLAKGVATAIVQLARTVKEKPLEEGEALQAIGAILGLFVEVPPLLPQGDFFGRRLDTLGLAPPAQRELIAKVNAATGADFQLRGARRSEERHSLLTLFSPRHGADFTTRVRALFSREGVGQERAASLLGWPLEKVRAFEEGLGQITLPFLPSLADLRQLSLLEEVLEEGKGRGMVKWSQLMRAWKGEAGEEFDRWRHLAHQHYTPDLPWDLFGKNQIYPDNADALELLRELRQRDFPFADDPEWEIFRRLYHLDPEGRLARHPLEEKFRIKGTRRLSVPEGSWHSLRPGTPFYIYEMDFRVGVPLQEIVETLIGILEEQPANRTHVIFRGISVAAYRFQEIERLLRDHLSGVGKTLQGFLLVTPASSMVEFSRNRRGFSFIDYETTHREDFLYRGEDCRALLTRVREAPPAFWCHDALRSRP